MILHRLTIFLFAVAASLVLVQGASAANYLFIDPENRGAASEIEGGNACSATPNLQTSDDLNDRRQNPYCSIASALTSQYLKKGTIIYLRAGIHNFPATFRPAPTGGGSTNFKSSPVTVAPWGSEVDTVEVRAAAGATTFSNLRGWRFSRLYLKGAFVVSSTGGNNDGVAFSGNSFGNPVLDSAAAERASLNVTEATTGDTRNVILEKNTFNGGFTGATFCVRLSRLDRVSVGSNTFVNCPTVAISILGAGSAIAPVILNGNDISAVTGAGSAGISLAPLGTRNWTNVLINGNRIYNSPQSHGIRLTSAAAPAAAPSRAKITNNLVYGTLAATNGGNSLEVQRFSNLKIYNNTFASGGCRFSPSSATAPNKRLALVNNYFDTCSPSTSWVGSPSLASNWIEGYNRYGKGSLPTVPTGGHAHTSTIGPAVFANAAAGDYSPAATGSGLRNLGVGWTLAGTEIPKYMFLSTWFAKKTKKLSLGGYVTSRDINGISRRGTGRSDIGALEYDE